MQRTLLAIILRLLDALLQVSDPRILQINLTGFLEKNTSLFVKVGPMLDQDLQEFKCPLPWACSQGYLWVSESYSRVQQGQSCLMWIKVFSMCPLSPSMLVCTT